MKEEIFKQLQMSVNHFSSIPENEWFKLKKLFYLFEIKKDDFFVKEGDKPNTVGFVVSGIFRLYYITESGEEFNKSFCVKNDFLASYSALLENKESRLWIQALDNSKLLAADYKAYENLMNSHNCWHILSRRLAEYLFIKKEKRESQFLLDNAKTRYLQFLQDCPGLEARIKQYHVASYLGITPVALSRIRSQMKENKKTI